MAGKAQNLPYCLNAPNSRKVPEIPSITLFRSLSAVALAKADAFCASLRPKIRLPREIVKRYLTGLKSAFKIRVNPRLINDLRLRKITYEIIKLFLQNEPKSRKVKLNVNNVLTKNYEQMDTWSIGKNEPKTNPKRTQTNLIQSQFQGGTYSLTDGKITATFR
jgi:hypothetical protein